MHDFIHLRKASIINQREGGVLPAIPRSERLRDPAVYSSLLKIVNLKIIKDDTKEALQHTKAVSDYLKTLWDEFNWLFPDWDPSIDLQAYLQEANEPGEFVKMYGNFSSTDTDLQ